MLKSAQLYKDRLTEECIKTWYKPENIFYTGWTGDSIPELPDNNYNSHHFVSVDKNDDIMFIPDKGTHNVGIHENVQGAKAANRMADEAAGRKRPGEM